MSEKRARCRPPLIPARAETVILDLNAVASGPVSLDTFKEALGKFDFKPYRGKQVQLRGCAPTWAFLLVYERLRPLAPKIDYLIDDSKRGIPIPVKS